MNWTLSQLRAFCAVGDFGTMTAAAAHLGYTTGAVSQQISALQTAVSAELFIRDGRTMVLTDAGVNFLVHARAVLEAEQRAASALSGKNGGHGVAVRLGVFGSAALFALPRALQILRAREHPIAIQAFETALADMPEAILSGRIDIAISVDYPDAPNPPHRGLISTPLHSETFRMIMPPESDSHLGSEAELLRYSNTTDWILPPAELMFGKAVLFACARSGIHPKVRHAVHDTALSIALAESGVGITLATPLMLALRPTTARIVPLPEQASRTIVALTGHALSNRESVQGVLAALRETFAHAQTWETAHGVS